MPIFFFFWKTVTSDCCFVLPVSQPIGKTTTKQQTTKQQENNTHKKKTNNKKSNTAALSFADMERVKNFIVQYAEDHAVSLPGRVPGFKRDDIQLLPSSHPKSRVYRAYSESVDRAGNEDSKDFA